MREIAMKPVNTNDGCQESIDALCALNDAGLLDILAETPFPLCRGIVLHEPLSRHFESNYKQAAYGKGYASQAARYRLRTLYRAIEPLIG